MMGNPNGGCNNPTIAEAVINGIVVAMGSAEFSTASLREISDLFKEAAAKLDTLVWARSA